MYVEYKKKPNDKARMINGRLYYSPYHDAIFLYSLFCGTCMLMELYGGEDRTKRWAWEISEHEMHPELAGRSLVELQDGDTITVRR